MAKIADNTLTVALSGLDNIERGQHITDEQLRCLQTTVWAWMDKSQDVVPTALHKQGSAIKQHQVNAYKALRTSIDVFEYMLKHGTSKTKAAQWQGGILQGGICERTAMTRLNESPIKTPSQAKRFNQLIARVKESLQKKP